MPKFFKFVKLNERGIVHLIPLLLILVGIVAGVYLVSHPQIFRPKASAENVSWILKSEDPANSCVEVKDGQNVATCPTVEFNLTSPLETNESSDAGFQLVKTAYAAGLIESADSYYYCTKLTCSQGTECSLIKYESQGGGNWQGAACVNSVGAPVLDKSAGWKCNDEGKIHKDGGVGIGDLRFSDINIVCPENTECSEEDTYEVTCGPSGGQSTPQISTGRYCGSGEDKDKIFENYLPVKNCANEGKTCGLVSAPEVPEGQVAICVGGDQDPVCKDLFGVTFSNNAQGATIYNSENSSFSQGQQISGVFQAFYCDEAGGAACADDFANPSVGKVLVSQPVRITIPAKGTSSSVSFSDLSGGISFNDLLKKLPSACGRIQVDIGVGQICSNNSGVIGGTVYNLGQCGTAGSTGSAPVSCPDKKETYGQCGGTTGLEDLDPTHVFEVTKVTDCNGRLKPYPKPVDKGVSDQCQKTTTGTGGTQLPGSQTVNTCKNETKTWDQIDSELQTAQYDGAFDHSPSELAAYNRTVCPAAVTAPTENQPKRTTKAYRLAENPDDLANATWQAYIPGRTTKVRYTFLNHKAGTKYIYIQFQDDQDKTFGATATSETPLTVAIKLLGAAQVTDNNTSANCPADNWKQFSITRLKEQCSLTDLSKLPAEALKAFSNQDVLDIAKAVDGEGGPYNFLASDKFDNTRLATFSLDVLKKLPDYRVNTLPKDLKDAIKGTSSASSETASCSGITVSDKTVTAYFGGRLSALKIWIASNSDIGKDAASVGSWTLVKTVSVTPPEVQTTTAIDTAGFSTGSHAILMSLHGSYGQMLDGNPGGVVNTKCTTTLTIQ